MCDDVCFKLNDELLHVETGLLYFVSSVWNYYFCESLPVSNQKVVLVDKRGRCKVIATSKNLLNDEINNGVWEF